MKPTDDEFYITLDERSCCGEYMKDMAILQQAAEQFKEQNQ
jgi:hypothetical protein